MLARTTFILHDSVIVIGDSGFKKSNLKKKESLLRLRLTIYLLLFRQVVFMVLHRQ